MSTYALRSKGSINYTHTMPHQGIPKNTAMESATNLHEEILMQKEEEIAVLRQRIEKKRRRQEGQDGEVEVLRERLKEMEQCTDPTRNTTIAFITSCKCLSTTTRTIQCETGQI